MEPGEYHLTVVENNPFDFVVQFNVGTELNYTPITDDMTGWHFRLNFVSKKTGITDIVFSSEAGSQFTIDNVTKTMFLHLTIAEAAEILPDHDYNEFEVKETGQEYYLYSYGSVKYIKRLT